MDEAEWRKSRGPSGMLAFLRRRGADEWKVRLFVCACWRARLGVVAEPVALLEEIEAVEWGRHHASARSGSRRT